MTGRDGIKGKNRRGMAVLGGAVGAFAAAAAMATGSAVTAAPAKADFEDLLDPIIQPLITSLSDAIAGFDPTAAADLTSWTDSFLSSLNALDMTAALPSAAEPAAAATTLTGSDVIPLSVQEGTEPTVNVSVDGSTPLATLVDTGSSGLLVPLNDLSLTQLFDLGFPTGINAVSFSGGIEAFYLEYNDATVGFGDGAVTTTNTPVDVAFFSFPTSFSAGSPLDFQQFLADNASPGGILGIGASGETGPGIGPFEAAGVTGVTVDAPQHELVLGPNAGTPIETLTGAATPTSNLIETVTNSSNQVIGTGSVSDDVDSGGVFGTIPSSLVGNAGSVPVGDTITVSDGNTVLYSYTVANDGVFDSPTVVSGTSIDSGFAPFFQEPIFISYGGTPADGAITFDKPLT